MKMITLSKNDYNNEFLDNHQNATTWIAMSSYFDEIYIIVQSKKNKFHKDKYKNINVYLLPKVFEPLNSILYIVLAIVLGIFLVFTNKIECINCGEPICGGISATVIKWITRKKMVVQLQGELFNLPKDRFSEKRIKITKIISKFVCFNANKIRAVSKKVAEQAIEAGVNKEKIIVIPSRCDINKFNPEDWKDTRDFLRNELGYSKDDIIVIFVGRFIISKGINYILDAFDLLKNEKNNIKLLLVGNGELDEELRKKVEEFSLMDIVKFYGFAPYEKIPSLLACADIFLSPSIDEGMPRSVLEAQAMELPVIVTPVGGNPEIVIDGETGVLVETRNSIEIIEALKELCDDKENMINMGKKAREFVKKNHSFEENIKLFAQIHYMDIEK